MLGGVVLALALLRDLPVDVAQAGVGVVVEVPAKDERRDQRIELVVPRARERARLQPCVALPRAPLGDQVLLERRKGHREGPAFAVGSQPHVDAKDIAIRRDLVQRADDAPAEPLEELAIGQRLRAIRLAVLRVDEDEIDVGGHVELAPAELAHADHHEVLRGAVLVARLAVLGRQRAPVERDGGVQGGLGERRHVGADLGQIGARAHVAGERVHEDAAAQAAQFCRQRERVASLGGGAQRRFRGDPGEWSAEGRGELLPLFRVRVERRGRVSTVGESGGEIGRNGHGTEV